MKYQVETDIVMPDAQEKHLLRLLGDNFYPNSEGWKAAKCMREYTAYAVFTWGFGFLFLQISRIGAQLGS